MPGPLHSFLFTLTIVHLYRCLSCDMKDALGQYIATKPRFFKSFLKKDSSISIHMRNIQTLAIEIYKVANISP